MLFLFLALLFASHSYYLIDCKNVSGSEYWFGNKCENTMKLFEKKKQIAVQIEKLESVALSRSRSNLQQGVDTSQTEDAMKYHVYKLFSREIDDSEAFVYSAMNVLTETLKGEWCLH